MLNIAFGALLVFAGVFSPLAQAATTNAGASLTVPDYFSDIARRVARRIPHEHFLRLPLDDALSSVAWSNYLGSLDYEHLYFTKTDIDRFRVHEFAMDDSLEDGDLAAAYEIFSTFRERVQDRTRYVAQLLATNFDLTVSETYHWQRKDAPWPVDEAEWNELWRKKIKNEYLRHYVRRLKAPEPIYETRTNFLGFVIQEPVSPTSSTNALPSPEQVVLKGYNQFYDMIVNCDAEWVLQKYISSFTHAYDPHSDYMSQTDVEEFDIEMKLSLVGIGALLSSEDGTAEVVSLIPGGPADLDQRDVKLQPKDRIVAVAEEGQPAVDILHLPLRQVVKKIRGQKGTRVILTVVPASDPSGGTTKTVDLVRDQVKLEDQAASWKLHQTTDEAGTTRKVAVLKLPAFYASMGDESRGDDGYRSSTYDVAMLLQQVQTNDVDGLILDLRNNGGGALVEAVNMTGLFIPSGPVVQVKEGRFLGRSYYDRDPSMLYDGPMIVLVSRLSASASEILAAALQDFGRAIVVGDSKTHGKGSVQIIQDISRNERFGSVKITNAAYYRISGRSTQLAGVAADIIVSSPYDMMELGEEFLPLPLKCEPVDPEDYKPLEDLDNVIGVLREKSFTRRKADPDYQAYERLLERVKMVQSNEELPLELEARKELAAMEENVDDLQKDRMEEQRSAGKDNETDDTEELDDIVLQETLHIMGDYIAFEENPAPVAGTTSAMTPGEGEWPERIRNWIKDMTL